MKKALFLFFTLTVFSLSAQIERGKSKVFQKPNKKVEKEIRKEMEKEKLEKQKHDEDRDFVFEESPKLRFSTDYEEKATELPTKAFEPVKELNETVSEDTSTIDEGFQDAELTQLEEVATFEGSDKPVTISKYYEIWDEKKVNPYGIDGRDFDEYLPIKLFDEAKGQSWSAPLRTDELTSTFKWRKGRMHTGVDLDLETGDPVLAAFSGTVRVASYMGAYGYCVVLRHESGIETLYGHMSKLNFEPNQWVSFGEEIGRGGSTGRSTGSHLHFELMYEGNRFDPEEIFQWPGNKLKKKEFTLTPDHFNYLRGGRSKIASEYTSIEDLSSGPQLELEEEDENQPIKIEKIRRVKARPGDNLHIVANRYKLSVGQLAKLNNFSTKHRLRVGEYVRVR